ncbi:MAG: SNF2-related protein, partial [Chromatiales bacterium]
MSKVPHDTRSLDLFADETPVDAQAHRLQWPEASRFPLNVDRRRVGDTVLEDLRASPEPLICTGYASLDRLVDFIAGCPEAARVRILLGAEPFPSRRESFEVRGYSFPHEVEQYWLRRGISLRLSAQIIRCIERLESGRVAARYISDPGHRLHAKIYVGEHAATLGSSNFTAPGLDGSLEANARFAADKDRARYREIERIAENYWTLGRDYGAELGALLHALLRKVGWQEALARACAELLEGDWADDFLHESYLPGEAEIWPSQRQGIAQALYVLSRQGSVLVADATGSGKTRMGANLIRAILDQIARSGRLRKGKALMVCPPAVEETWQWESTVAGTPLETFSHGALSHARAGRHALTVESLRRAQILCVDEGHNFLNLKSNRSQHLLRNMADHVLLFTATPLNRSVIDLLRIADMLGADNLEPATLQAFKKMLGVRDINRSLTEEEIRTLRGEIQKFTVRRTKRELNALIEREPDAYRDRTGRPCRFPAHEPRIYPLDEPNADRALAKEIRELAGDLHAVSHFVRPIEMPDVLARQGWSEESYLQGRLRSARKIARYVIMASLRSSRLALAEHIAGTRRAVEELDLPGFRKHADTGDMLERLERIRGRPPRNRLGIVLPDWLADPEAHAAACDADREIYARIYALLRQMSDARELAKAALLLELIERHELLLAFDRSPITLAGIRRHIAALAPEQRVIIATGDPGSERVQVLREFRPGSASKRIIGLCSDSLSEGVNLQQASCMVHLDMPSVVRIAEQRAGRVDRMDSPHESIEAWWPQDAPEFALSSDEHFVERYETVDSLLGSNMPLPGEMLPGGSAPVRAEAVIQEYETQAERTQWDDIHDAFEPVRALVEGERSLVGPAAYEAFRGAKADVQSRVSVVRAGRPWAFFCLAGGTFRAPHWILFPSLSGRAVTELGEVCRHLRERLSPDTEDLAMGKTAAGVLDGFIARLADAERALLPRKKQRALVEMEQVLKHFLEAASDRRDQEAVDHYDAILRMIRPAGGPQQPDWDEVAGRWLDLIRP